MYYQGDLYMTYRQLDTLVQKKTAYIGRWNKMYLAARAHGQTQHNIVTSFDLAELKVLQWVLAANQRKRRDEDIQVPGSLDKTLFFDLIASLKLN